jgi:hypothetical protein
METLEVKKYKQETEEIIKKLLIDLEQKTGMKVNSPIDVNHIWEGKRRWTIFSVELELTL